MPWSLMVFWQLDPPGHEDVILPWFTDQASKGTGGPAAISGKGDSRKIAEIADATPRQTAIKNLSWNIDLVACYRPIAGFFQRWVNKNANEWYGSLA